jgi:Ca2+-binding EF-hand superfamily protein
MDEGTIHNRKMHYLRNLWAEADLNADSRLDMGEIEKLLVKINFYVSKDYLQKLFKKYDRDRSGYIDFNEFENIMDSLRSHSEIHELFKRYRNPVTQLITA